MDKCDKCDSKGERKGSHKFLRNGLGTNGLDYICSNGGHCVFEEELVRAFRTDGAGLKKLLDPSIVLTDDDIEVFIEAELKKQETAVIAEVQLSD